MQIASSMQMVMRPKPRPRVIWASAPAASQDLTINFPTGSDKLTLAAQASLQPLGEALTSDELANSRYPIEGHTDNVGTEEDNLKLSQRRAESVVSYLMDKYKVQSSRLKAVGKGDQQPWSRHRHTRRNHRIAGSALS